MVINYDSAWRDPFAAWAEKVQWDLVIADEAHRIKTPGGKASLFFKRLRLHADHRIALTGTPMPHGPMDIYAHVPVPGRDDLRPVVHGVPAKYAVMGGYQRKQITGFQNLDELEAQMSRITFRVGNEVLDLPPATDVTYHCDLTGEAARIYKDLEEDFVARVKDGTVTAANAMVKLLRLQQVTGGCVPTDDGTIHRIDSAKQKLLADTLEDIGKDEPVVVFCRFTADLMAVHEACEGMGLHLDGTLRPAGRTEAVAGRRGAGARGPDRCRRRGRGLHARPVLDLLLGRVLARQVRPGAEAHASARPDEARNAHPPDRARNTVDVKIMRALEKRADIVKAILAEIKN